MNSRVRIPLEDLRQGPRTLSAEQAHYLLRVRRLAEGDRFLAFDPKSGLECDGAVVSREGDIALDGPRHAPPDHPVLWIHALAKGDKCDAIVRDATELGATDIVFTKTARSIVDLAADRASRRLARWEKIAEEAARQSERRRGPSVRIVPFEEALAQRGDAVRAFLYEEATLPLADVLDASATAFAFFAGPEGGFEPEEASLASAAGWKLASLGTRILRTETVPAAVLGALQFMTLGPPRP